MPWFARILKDGTQLIDELESAPPKPKGGSVHEIGRAPEDGEKWDPAVEAFAMDHAAAADMNLPVGHLDRSHMRKYAEALLIMSGVELSAGILVQEAAVRGLTQGEMAGLVYSKVQPEIDRERARMARKVTGQVR